MTSPAFPPSLILPKNLSCWVITEGMAGTENQCLAVCDHLGISPEVKRIKLRQPWKTFAPGFRIFKSLATSPSGDRIAPPYPDLVIASGRKAVLPSLHIKRASQHNTIVIFIQDPGIDPKYFDMVAVPFHDGLRGPNVLVTDGAPNRVKHLMNQPVKTKWDSALSKLSYPRVAVFIGGKSKRHDLPLNRAKEIALNLHRLQKNYGASLMISVSRRTPAKIIDFLKDNLLGADQCILWTGDQDGKNPYTAFFNHADHFLITEDSVSMLSEAASTGKPVYRLAMDGDAGKLQNFYIYMEERDIVRPFNGTLDQWSYRPLNDAAMVAAIIKNILSTGKM